MRKWQKTILLIILSFSFLLFLTLPTIALTTNEITRYKIDMDVSDHAIVNVVETIHIENSDALMWERAIKQNYQYDSDKDGIKEDFIYGISNLSVDEQDYSTSTKDGDMIVQVALGQSNDEIVLRYQLKMKDFQLEEKKLFYLSLISPLNNYDINQLDVNITLPYEPDVNFVISRIDASGNEIGNQANNYQLNDKTMTINQSNIKQGEGIDVVAEVKASFFDYGEAINIHFYMTIFSVVLVMGSYFIFIRGFHLKKRETAYECYPFTDMDPIMLDYIINGRIERENVMAVIMDWANRGLIQIREENQTVILVIVQELGIHAPSYERALFDLIFEDFTMVTIDQLYVRNLLPELDRILHSVYIYMMKEHSKPLYTTSLIPLQIALSLLSSLPFAFTMYACSYMESYAVLTSLLKASLASALLALNCLPWIYILYQRPRLSKNTKDVYMLLTSLFNFIFGGLAYNYLLVHQTPTSYAVIAVVMTILAIVVFLFMDKPTALGRNKRNRLTSLNYFMRHVGQKQLDNLLYDNNEYFALLLPYAYTFKIMDIWGKKFASFPISAPYWFYSANAQSNSPMYWLTSLLNSLQAIRNAILFDSETSKQTNKKKKPKQDAKAMYFKK